MRQPAGSHFEKSFALQVLWKIDFRFSPNRAAEECQ
jgi:hypothetical protein